METSALADIGHVAKVIEACNSLGIQFALDDFGSGDSSLTYLKRLPAHTLKIDQIIVRDMLENPEDLAILEGIIGLAEAFRRLAIAEGWKRWRRVQCCLIWAANWRRASPLPGRCRRRTSLPGSEACAAARAG